MRGRTLFIREVWRTLEGASDERLPFETGVNVIVGDHNTGKTKWLETIDYLMGDDLKPQEREHGDIYKKYSSVQMRIVIAGEELHVERRWSQGLTSKVIVNGESLTLERYRALLREKLEIPEVHYPLGSPYREQAWPEVGWRSLYRHMYRWQDEGWGDLVPKQPANEQHAVLMQFLGVADQLFSEEYGALVRHNKDIAKLEWQREQYISMLQELSHELLETQELGVALTPQSIEAAMSRLQSEQENLHAQREQLLHSLRESSATIGASTTAPELVNDLGEELAGLQQAREELVGSERKAGSRLIELREYRRILADEVDRMQRVHEAGSVLVDLRVTHCPACDQEVLRVPVSDRECYLCKQPKEDTGPLPDKRIEFEIEQLTTELQETDELIEVLQEELQGLVGQRTENDTRQSDIRQKLKPIRTAAASILPPELAVIDIESGRRQERVRQLEKVRSSLDRREELSKRIAEIQAKVAELEAKAAEKSVEVDLYELGTIVADAMNTYLNELNVRRPNAWTQKDVSIKISERAFAVKVGQADWKIKLGSTLKMYLVLAYHYALMSVTPREQCRYPGLAVLDFPATLDGASIKDKENFVVEPFVQLLAKKGMEGTQLIVAGSSFEGLEGVHRIELTKVWKD